MLDSGPLISLYSPRDTRRQTIAEELKRLQMLKYPVCTTYLTVAETHRRLLFDVGHLDAVRFLKNVHDGSVNILEVTAADVCEAIGIIERYSDQLITCCDAVSMALMKRFGIRKVLSYDHHFWILNFEVLQGGWIG